MKPSHLLRLTDWVEANRGWIQSEENPQFSAIRERAENELGYKCPESNLRAVFDYIGLPTRRTKSEAKIRELEQRIHEYRQQLVTVCALTMGMLPDSVQKTLRDRFDIQQEMLSALSVHPRSQAVTADPSVMPSGIAS